jgi:hypothetical protein
MYQSSFIKLKLIHYVIHTIVRELGSLIEIIFTSLSSKNYYHEVGRFM